MGNALSTVGEAVLRLAAASQNAEAETRPLAHAHGGLGAAATSPDAGGDLAHDDHAMRDGGGQSVRFSFRRLQNMLSNTLLRVELFILVSLQRSGTTWFVEEMAKSPCVRAEHEIFDGFEGKVHGQAHSDDEER